MTGAGKFYLCVMVLASIRKLSGKKKLKKLPFSAAKPVQYSHIQHIGLIYYLDDDSNLKHLQKVLKHPFMEGKTVDVICWLKATKKKPHPSITGVVFVDRNDFDSNYLPSSKNARYFCDHSFDVLFDLTTEYYFPMHALSVMSNAKLKTGLDHKMNWQLQLRIKPTEGKRQSTMYLFDQILIYIQQLFP